MEKYQVCSRCVMDTSDPLISFNEKGDCSHCQKFDEVLQPSWKSLDEEWLEKKIARIKKEQENAPYDVVIGVSGGIDSSYLLHLMKTHYHLRILAVHVNAGWNTKAAETNIQKMFHKLNSCGGGGILLHNLEIDWEEMRDLSVAFLRSGLANCDVPQDMAFFAALYEYAIKNNVRFVLTGYNYATESILPSAWGHFAMDSVLLKDVHRRFGKKPLVTFPIASFFDYYVRYPKICKMEVLSPLNSLVYNKEIAKDTLTKEYGWEDYGSKHCESIWTKFFQEYFLPKRFGYDKRRAHYSSMILAGDMSREEALKKLESPAYDEKNLEKDLAYILDKLELSRKEWEEIMALPCKSYKDYRNNEELYQYKKQYLDKFFE